MPARRRSAKTVDAPVKKSPSAKVTVTKYTKPLDEIEMTETPVEAPQGKDRKFAPTRPEKPNLTYVDYVEDFKVRMQINNYEVIEFIDDCKRAYKTVHPYIIKASDYTVKTFNQIRESLSQPVGVTSTTQTEE